MSATAPRIEHDPDRARRALLALDPGIDRDTWVTIAMTAKAAGIDFDTFDQWSAQAANYRKADCASMWRSVKADGKTGPGTLFKMAQDAGWRDESPQQKSTKQKPAFDVHAAWRNCKQATADQEYIKRKSGDPTGLRVYHGPLTIAGHAVDGALVVPVYSLDGELQTLQFILTDKKLNAPGRPVAGIFIVGNIEASTIYIVEGIGQAWACHKAAGGAAVATLGAGRMDGITKELRARYPSARLVLVADAGKESQCEHIARSIGCAWVEMPTGSPSNFDCNDLSQRDGIEALAEVLNDPKEHPRTNLQAITLHDLLAMELPPRRNLLDPWLPAQGLAMIYAPRGIGKTHIAQGIAYALICGGPFLTWRASEPAGVLYLDGEMPAAAMQERFAGIVAASNLSPVAPLRILSPDLQQCGMPDLSTESGQAQIDELIDADTKLIIVDNLSTFCRSGEENAAESWLPVQTWALRHRAAGRSILFIHHAGKGGAQRGTSRREDVLDTVIALKRPADYSPEQGARVEVHFEKARGIFGKDTAPIEASLGMDAAGRLVWATKTLEQSTFEQVAALAKDGLTQRDISIELSIDKSRVSRHLKRARQEGLLDGQ